MVIQMQLVDFLTSDFLNELRSQMKAKLLDITDLPFRNGITYADLYDLHEGVEVDIGDITSSPSGLLYYKGVMVSLNIQDAFQGNKQEESLPKLHICHCHKLKEMKAAGRIQRYVCSARTDKIRKIRFISNYTNQIKSGEYDLDVCKYCLSQLKLNGYKTSMTPMEKNQISKKLDLSDFYLKFEPQFYQAMIQVLYTDQNDIIVNQYQMDWKYISYKYRKSKQWRCEACTKDCTHDHANLHTHHINGNKADNRLINLSALCYDCHAMQPMHEHMRR